MMAPFHWGSNRFNGKRRGSLASRKGDQKLRVRSDRICFRQESRIQGIPFSVVQLVAGRQDLQRPAKQGVGIRDFGQITARIP